MAAAARPLVTVYTVEGDIATDTRQTIPIPDVMRAPIRPDSNISKNSRQPYAVSRKTGHQTSAVSWGTGRAVSRIPRVAGGGTHRAGQAAFGNMCRGGRMFAPFRIWLKWHRKINVNHKRYSVVSAIAASAIRSLVVARGHLIESVPEIPLVVADSAEGVEKTKDAIKLLKSIGAYPDAEKAKDSLGIRSGKGKMRNRRYISRKGPLIVFGTEGVKAVKAFRNIPGVEITYVERLNLLKLAPGGHLGRFVIWTKTAFEKLDSIYGLFDKASDEVQSVVRPFKEMKRSTLKKNPLKNLNVMHRLNPYAKTAKRMALLAEAERVKAKKEKFDKKRKTVSKEEASAIKEAGKAWYRTMVSDSHYIKFDNDKIAERMALLAAAKTEPINNDEDSMRKMPRFRPNWPLRGGFCDKSLPNRYLANFPVKTPVQKLQEELDLKQIILNSVRRHIGKLEDGDLKSDELDLERKLIDQVAKLNEELEKMKMVEELK